MKKKHLANLVAHLAVCQAVDYADTQFDRAVFPDSWAICVAEKAQELCFDSDYGIDELNIMSKALRRRLKRAEYRTRPNHEMQKELQIKREVRSAYFRMAKNLQYFLMNEFMESDEGEMEKTLDFLRRFADSIRNTAHPSELMALDMNVQSDVVTEVINTPS